MKPIIKNIFKNYLKNIATFVLFIVCNLVLSIGFLSTPLKLKTDLNKITQNVNDWDYNQRLGFQSIDDSSFYNYLFAIDDNFITNSFQTPLWNLDAQIVNKANQTQKLGEFLINRYEKSGNPKKTYTKWLINYLRVNFFNLRSVNLLRDKIVFGDGYSGQLSEIVSPEWLEYLTGHSFSPFYLLGQDLQNKFDPYQQVFKSEYSTKVTTEIPLNDYSGLSKVIFEEANLGQSDNVVITQGNQNLQTLETGEVIVNSKFAQKNKIAIGSSIKLPLFLDSAKENSYFGGDFQVKALGIKITDLISRKATRGAFYFYLNKVEMANLNKYITLFGNTLTTDSQVIPHFASVRFDNFLRLQNGNNIDSYQQFLLKNGVKHFALQKNDISNLVSVLDILKIQILFVIVINVFNLIILLIFLKMFLDNLIKINLPQWGVLLANGWAAKTIAFTFSWLITLICSVLALVSFGISIPLQRITNTYFTNRLNIAIPAINSRASFLVLFFVLVPILIGLIAYLFSWTKLNKPPMELIYPIKTSKITKHQFKLAGVKSVNLKIHLRFYLVDFASHFYTFILFFLTNALVIVQLSIPNFMNQTKDNLLFFTTPNISYKDGKNNLLEWTLKNEKWFLQNHESLPQFSPYSQDQKIDFNDDFHNLTNQYLTTNRQDPNIQAKLLLILLTMQNLNINQQVITFKDLNSFTTTLIEDKSSVWANNKSILTLIEKLEKNIQPLLNQIKSNVVDGGNQTLLSLNNVYLNRKQRFITAIPLVSQTSNFYTDKFNLVLLSENNADIFKGGFKSLTTLKRAQGNIMPIVINNRLASQNGVKIGDSLEMRISLESTKRVKLKIVGINEKDNRSPHLYASEDFFRKNMLDASLANVNFYNQMYSSEPWEINTQAKHQNLKVDFINLLFGTQKVDQIEKYPLTKVIKIKDIMANFTNLALFNGLPYVNNDFVSFTVERQKITEATSQLSRIIYIMATGELIMIFILIFVIIKYLLSLKSNNLVMLKSLGYYPYQLTNFVFLTYLFDFILALGLSFIFLYILLKISQNVVWQNHKIWLAMAFQSYFIVWPIILTVVVFGLVWATSAYFIGKLDPRYSSET